MSKLPQRGQKYIEQTLDDSNSDMRITALRAAQEIQLDIIPYVAKLVRDPSPQVRRECALALRHDKSPRAPELWAELAVQHNGADRWYLEALGIGADRQWDSYFAAWLKKVGDNWNTPGGRDIIWRSRAKAAMPLLAKLILDPSTTPDERVRYFRAFDFHTDPSKEAVLISLLTGHHPDQAAIGALALRQLHGVRLDSPRFAAALSARSTAAAGPSSFSIS